MRRQLEKIRYYSRVLVAMHVRRSVITPYIPQYVAIEVTNVCNFRCAFCPQADPRHHELVPKDYLDPDRCEKILQEIRAAGITTELMHWTQDGEPFMNKRFADLVDLGVRHGFTNCHFATNGVLSTVDRLLEFPLKDCRLTLAIDYCTDPAYFEEVRGTKGSWEAVRENVGAILAHEALGNVYISISDISPYKFRSPEELSQRHRALIDLFPESKRLRIYGKTFHNATGLVEGPANAGHAYHLCPYPWTALRIACNGDVVVCCRDLRRQTVLGNVFEQRIMDIWNGDRMQEVRRHLLDKRPDAIEACRGCDLPYDDSKFSLRNMLKTLRERTQILSR
jgi:radical SAM protein with 4Fe4S-binding SPASM domain